MKLLLVEDEASAARRLMRLVHDHLPKSRLIHAIDLATAIAQLRITTFDGILLDLNLAGSDGFDVLRAAGDTPVIVVSAHADRALEAFDHAVLDFVAKPVLAARFARALDRLAAFGGAARPVTLIVRGAGRVDIVDCASILRIQGADDYAELVLADGRHLLHDTGLAVLERRLPPRFMRIHRSHIINLETLTAIVRTEAGSAAALSNHEQIPISRRRLAMVEKAVGRA